MKNKDTVKNLWIRCRDLRSQRDDLKTQYHDAYRRLNKDQRKQVALWDKQSSQDGVYYDVQHTAELLGEYYKKEQELSAARLALFLAVVDRQNEWGDFRKSVDSVRKLKKSLADQKANFECVINSQVCRKYERFVGCPVDSCPHHEWRKKYYDTENDLWAARAARTKAFWHLFIKSK